MGRLPVSPQGQRTALVVLHGEVLGGASISVLRAVPELETRGWRFVFWVARPSALFDEIRRRGLEVHGEPLPFLGYSWKALRIEPGPMRRTARAPSYFRGLSRALRDIRPDVVHLNSLYAMAEAVVVRSHGIPALLHVHEMVAPGWKGAVARRLGARLAAASAGVSQAGAEALSTGRRRALTLYEGVLDEGPLEADRHGPTVVGTIGVISPRKGTDVFVQAARLVAKTTDQITFRIAGGADNPLDRRFAAEVLAEADGLGIAYAERVAARDELARLDVFAMPSRSDPFPLAVLDAMAAGVPVVGSRVDGIAEQLAGGAGVLVDPDDPRALADGILELHADPDRRRSIGAAGRQRALDRFSVARQADALESAYLAAIGA